MRSGNCCQIDELSGNKNKRVRKSSAVKVTIKWIRSVLNVNTKNVDCGIPITPDGMPYIT